MTSTKRIGFYVYNTKTPDKVFDMSEAQKVLLPQSDDKFSAILVAENGDFTFRLDYSSSVLGKSIVIALGFFLAFASYF